MRPNWERLPDDPITPPPTVQAHIPKFWLCDEVAACTIANPDLITDVCSACQRSFPFTNLHLLQCRHKLCHGCLNAAAAQSLARFEARFEDVRLMADVLENSTDDLAAFYAGEEEPPEEGYYTPEPEQADPAMRERILKAKIREKEDTLLRQCGMMCCGQDVFGVVGTYYCLERTTAEKLWLARQYMSSSNRLRRYCGWADCGAFIPERCSWECDPRDETYIKHYCVRCDGNSIPCSSVWELRPGR